MISALPSALVETTFLCNVCGGEGHFQQEHYENAELPSCAVCGSNGRFRWLVHRLSLHLFGCSLPLSEFPVRKNIKGIGLTDPSSIATVLADRFDYVNTSLTGEPRLDIRCDPSPVGPLDFLIASEVFEHVEGPVERAFENAARLLKPGGLLLLTVPWVWGGDAHTAIPELHDWRLGSEDDGYVIVNRRRDGTEEKFRRMAFDGSPGPSFGWTREHFPHLHDWRVSEVEGAFELENTRRDGTVETFRNLVFHEGPGLALEMRLFTKGGIEANLQAAGFGEIEFQMENVHECGILFGHPWSRPVSARAKLR